jgi:glycosyltransferase involved in cell wall biosynthesis
LAARLAGVRHVYVTEHLAPDQQLPRAERWRRDMFSRMISGIVCVSQKNFQARSTYLYTPPERTIVVNNGVDLDDFPPIPEQTLAQLRTRCQLPGDAQIVGTAVRFEPEKGLNYLIEAMPQIKAACPKAYFLMVGDGSLRDELAAQVAQLGMTDCVRFVGFQSDPRPYLGLMDAFVLPVPVGSMSIGLLEAMAMQRAVVITFGGKGEAVIHGESGFCAEPRNAASIAEFVIQILQKPELKNALGNAARQRVEAEFSAQQVARSLSALYARSGR